MRRPAPGLPRLSPEETEAPVADSEPTEAPAAEPEAPVAAVGEIVNEGTVWPPPRRASPAPCP